jgi:transcriptional regulator with XRE-family HTH domain
MSGLVSTIREELASKEFRDRYVAENSRRGVAYQITALREDRGWSRAEFARQAGRPQSNVSRWEDPTYGKYSLSTLIEIASIFDVALIAKFVGFEELLTSVADLRPSKLAVLSYEKEQEYWRRQYRDRLSGGSAIDAFFKMPEQRRAFGEGALKENSRIDEPFLGDERTKVRGQTETKSALAELSETAPA